MSNMLGRTKPHYCCTHCEKDTMSAKRARERRQWIKELNMETETERDSVPRR